MAILKPSTHTNAHPPTPFCSLPINHHFIKKVPYDISLSILYSTHACIEQKQRSIKIVLLFFSEHNHAQKPHQKRFWVALYRMISKEEGVWQFKVSNNSTFLHIYIQQFHCLAITFNNNTQNGVLDIRYLIHEHKTQLVTVVQFFIKL